MLSKITNEQIQTHNADWTCDRCHYGKGERGQQCWYLSRYDGIDNGFCPALEAQMPKNGSIRELIGKTDTRSDKIADSGVSLGDITEKAEKTLEAAQIKWLEIIKEFGSKDMEDEDVRRKAMAAMAFFGMTVKQMTTVLGYAHQSTTYDKINVMNGNKRARGKKEKEAVEDRKSDIEIRTESAIVAGGEEFAAKREEQIAYLAHQDTLPEDQKNLWVNVDYPVAEYFYQEVSLLQSDHPAGWTLKPGNKKYKGYKGGIVRPKGTGPDA